MPPRIPDKTRYDLEWDRVIDELAGYAVTFAGRARCLDLPFFDTCAEAALELTRVSEFRALLHTAEPPSLAGVSSAASDLIRNARKGAVLTIEELLDVADTVDAANRLAARMRQGQAASPALFDLCEAITELPEPARVVHKAIDRTHRQLRDSASPDLGPLRQKVRSLHQKVKGKLDSLLTSEEVKPLLRDTYFTIRDDRYVLPVKTAEKAGLKGIVHGSSGTGQTLYVEPREMVALNNDLTLAQMDVQREELRILRELSGFLGEHAAPVAANLEILTRLDVVQAKARLAEELACSEPELVEESRFHLLAARHPLLLLKQTDVVPNDLYLGDAFHVLILSGANTGGKTVALKTMGLCVLMAWAGMHVPARQGSVVGRFLQVFTVMGDEQSLADDLSTFSANITNLNHVLTECDARSLVLLDEIVVGTDPRQGAALAQAVVEGMAENGARCVVTTHYERLKRLAFSRTDFANAAVGLSETTLKPNFHILIGVSGASSAFDIASDLGVLAPVVSRARTLMEGETDELDGIIARLQGEVIRQQERNRELEEAKRDLERLQGDLAARMAALEARERQELVVRRRDVLEEIEKAREEVRGIIRDLQGGPRRMAEASAAMHSLAEVETREAAKEREAVRRLEEVAPPRTSSNPRDSSRRTLRADEITEGARVYIANLGQTGVIVEPPDRRGQALVEVGRLKMRIPAERLLTTLASEGPTGLGGERNTLREAITQARQDAPDIQSITLDLRGERVEEALSLTEAFLDRAVQRNTPFVYIIHGHGTGRLKAAIREAAARSPYVTSFRPGQRGEGQDGVTVVMLRTR